MAAGILLCFSSLRCNSPTCSQAATKFQPPFFSFNSFNPFNLFNPFGCGFAALRSSRLCGLIELQEFDQPAEILTEDTV